MHARLKILDQPKVYGASPDPEPLSWQEFYRDWSCACVEAWEEGQSRPSVTLPLNMFPHVTAVENPCTGEFVEIARRSPFTWTSA